MEAPARHDGRVLMLWSHPNFENALFDSDFDSVVVFEIHNIDSKRGNDLLVVTCEDDYCEASFAECDLQVIPNQSTAATLLAASLMTFGVTPRKRITHA